MCPLITRFLITPPSIRTSTFISWPVSGVYGYPDRCQVYAGALTSVRGLQTPALCQRYAGILHLSWSVSVVCRSCVVPRCPGLPFILHILLFPVGGGGEGGSWSLLPVGRLWGAQGWINVGMPILPPSLTFLGFEPVNTSMQIIRSNQ